MNFPDEPSLPFFFLRPMKTPTGTNRMFADIYMPTETFSCFLAEELQQAGDLVKLQFYNVLSHHPYTRSGATFHL